MSFYRGIVDDVKNRAVDGIGKFPKIMFVRNDMPVYQKRRKRRGTERFGGVNVYHYFSPYILIPDYTIYETISRTFSDTSIFCNF